MIADAASIWGSWMFSMLWQGSLLILVVAVADRLIARWAWPQLRLTLWLLVVVKLILPPTLMSPVSLAPELPILESVLEAGSPATMAAQTAVTQAAVTQTAVTQTAVTSAITPATNSIGSSSIMSGLFVAWLVVTVLLTGMVVTRLRSTRRLLLVDASRHDVPAALQQLLHNTAARLGLRRVPELWVCSELDSPAVFGLRRPIVIIPAALLESMSPTELEHVLLHELAHIRRGDLYVHHLVLLLQVAYWFNPLLLLVRRRVGALRELCCDGTVAGVLRGSTADYRKTLLLGARRLINGESGPTGVRGTRHGSRLHSSRLHSNWGLVGLLGGGSLIMARLDWLERQTWRLARVRRVVNVAVVLAMAVFVLPMARASDDDSARPIAESIAKVTEAKMIAAETLRRAAAGERTSSLARRYAAMILAAPAEPADTAPPGRDPGD